MPGTSKTVGWGIGAAAGAAASVLLALSPGACGPTGPASAPPVGSIGSQVVPITQGGYQAPLIPVQIGNQVFNLLLDTGSNYLLVFDSLISPNNTAVQKTGDPVSLQFGSGTRSGHIAIAPVQIGQQFNEQMYILVVESPTAETDPSLTPKRADGIIGMRLEPGDVGENVIAQLDIPVVSLGIVRYQIALPSGGGLLGLGSSPGTLVLNQQPSFAALPGRTTTFSYSGDTAIYAGNSEVQYSVSTAGGSVADAGLLLLDTGANATLQVNSAVASQAGLNGLGGSSPVNVTLFGSGATFPVQPTITASQVDATRLSPANTYSGLLGLPRLSNWVFGFEYDPAAQVGSFKVIDQAGGTVPAPTGQPTSGPPQYLVVNDLAGATVLLNGAPLAYGAQVTIAPPATFTIEVTRQVINSATGQPFTRYYSRTYQPLPTFTAGTCLIEVSEGVAGADYLFAGVAPGADPTAGCNPCQGLTYRNCGSMATINAVATVP